MSNLKECGQCKREIPEHAPFGVCPFCVLNLATAKGESDGNAADLTGSHPQPADTPALEPHELTGKFPNLEIISLLGRGGMGAVYLARQTSLDRTVALKVLSSGLANDPSFTERFDREAKTLAQLTHPNIVTVFDSGQSGDANYLVMEYIDGVNLRDAIASGSIDPARALAIVQQICDALQHAHDAGVIHRDIKPENILIDRFGLVKIADFGLAKLLRPKPEQYSLTGTRQVLGTRNYMAPEQIETPDTVDHRADLYSLGVVLYELLTGELPIGRFSAPSKKTGCSERLDDLVMKTLEKDPRQRYQQASMIGSAVRELESSIEQSATRMPLVESITKAGSASPHSYVSDQPLVDPIPFTLSRLKSKRSLVKTGNVQLHLANAKGLLHAYGDRIELEYCVTDTMDPGFEELRSNVLKLDDIASVRFEPTWWGGARLRFHPMSLKAIEGFPRAAQGTFFVNVFNRDRGAARGFADVVNRKIVSRNPQRSGIKVRNFDPAVTLEEIVMVDERLKVPRIGFWVTAFGTLLAGLLITAVSLMSINDPERMALLNSYSPVPSYALLLLGPFFLLTSMLPIVVAKSLQHHRNYHLSIVLLLAMLLPYVSPLFFLQIPLAIWSLVVLCLPSTRKVFASATLRNRLETSAKPHGVALGRRRFSVGLSAGLFAVPALLIVVGMAVFWNTQTQKAENLALLRDTARQEAITNRLPSTTTPLSSEVKILDGESWLLENNPDLLTDLKRSGFGNIDAKVLPSGASGREGVLVQDSVWKPVPTTKTLSIRSWILISALAFLGFCSLFIVCTLSILGWRMIKKSKAA